MEKKREEILLCIARLASIGSESDNDASTICNAIEYLTEYSFLLEEQKQKENLEI